MGGEKVKIDSVYRFKTDTATAVYNLEASGNYNYYVSASKVLVHNCKKIELHHLLPRQFADKFKAVGLEIEEFKIPLTKDIHSLKPNGIHTKGGGNWNAVWKQFFETHKKPEREQILEQLEKMRKDFGI